MRIPISQSYLTQLLYTIEHNFHQNEITIEQSKPKYDEDSAIETVQKRNHQQIQKLARIIKARQWNEFLDTSDYLVDFQTYQTRFNQNHPDIPLAVKHLLTFQGTCSIHRNLDHDDQKPHYLKKEY